VVPSPIQGASSKWTTTRPLLYRSSPPLHIDRPQTVMHSFNCLGCVCFNIQGRQALEWQGSLSLRLRLQGAQPTNTTPSAQGSHGRHPVTEGLEGPHSGHTCTLAGSRRLAVRPTTYLCIRAIRQADAHKNGGRPWRA